jgi:hypothetical protein
VEDPLGVTTKNHVVFCAFDAPEFADVDLNTTRQNVRRTLLQPPPGVVPQSLAPQGDRLAWVSGNPPPSRFMERLNVLLGLRRYDHVGLWVSHMDGSGMTEIAHWVIQPLPIPSSVPRPIWTPDGRRLSIRVGNALWLIPAG